MSWDKLNANGYLWNQYLPFHDWNVVSNWESLFRCINLWPALASSLENILALAKWWRRSSIVGILWCGLLSVVFNCLGSSLFVWVGYVWKPVCWFYHFSGDIAFWEGGAHVIKLLFYGVFKMDQFVVPHSHWLVISQTYSQFYQSDLDRSEWVLQF